VAWRAACDNIANQLTIICCAKALRDHSKMLLLSYTFGNLRWSVVVCYFPPSPACAQTGALGDKNIYIIDMNIYIII